MGQSVEKFVTPPKKIAQARVDKKCTCTYSPLVLFFRIHVELNHLLITSLLISSLLICSTAFLPLVLPLASHFFLLIRLFATHSYPLIFFSAFLKIPHFSSHLLHSHHLLLSLHLSSLRHSPFLSVCFSSPSCPSPCLLFVFLNPIFFNFMSSSP